MKCLRNENRANTELRNVKKKGRENIVGGVNTVKEKLFSGRGVINSLKG